MRINICKQASFVNVLTYLMIIVIIIRYLKKNQDTHINMQNKMEGLYNYNTCIVYLLLVMQIVLILKC